MSAVAVARNPIKASETPDTVVLQHIARTPSSAATLWTPSILSASSLWVSIFGIWRIWRRLGCVRTTVMFFWCPFSTWATFYSTPNIHCKCQHACHAMPHNNTLVNTFFIFFLKGLENDARRVNISRVGDTAMYSLFFCSFSGLALAFVRASPRGSRLL
jgi:hypothetical protein